MFSNRRTVTSFLGTLALVAATAALGAAPASARIVERGEIHDTFGFTDDNFCAAGRTVDVTGTIDGRFQVHSRAPGGFWYYLEKTTVVQVFTDRATGKTATDIQPNTLNKDLSITTSADGKTVTVIALLTGGARTYGDSGKLIARNSGQVRFEIVFDAVTGEELSNTLVFGSTGTNDDFCEAVLADWGVA